MNLSTLRSIPSIKPTTASLWARPLFLSPAHKQHLLPFSSISSANQQQPHQPPSQKPEQSQPQQPKTTWSDYLTLRKHQRRRNQVFTFIGSPVAGASTFYYISNLEFLPSDTFMGMEVVWYYGISAIVGGVINATLTPVVLDALWRLLNPLKVGQLDLYDKELYRRIQKYRAPASLAGPQIHLFDYYGTTITSFHTYRHWLRRQFKTKSKARYLGQSNS